MPRGPLHKAAISGQYETVKMLLESGEDVDQRDQVLVLSTVYVNLMFSWTSCLRFALRFLNSFLVLALTD